MNSQLSRRPAPPPRWDEHSLHGLVRRSVPARSNECAKRVRKSSRVIVYSFAGDFRCETGVIVSVCVSMVFTQTKTLLNPEPTFGVAFTGDTDTVSVFVRSDKVRFFGLSSRQQTTRTRGGLTRCRKMDLRRILSG